MSDAKATNLSETTTGAVPSFMADVGNLTVAGHTLHLVLGSTTPDGLATHRAHIALSREFARELAETLLEGLKASAADRPSMMSTNELGGEPAAE